MNKKVIIIGGEGNGGVIAACIEDNRKRFGDLEWQVAGFVNDFEKQVCGYPVLGGTNNVQELLKEPDYYFMWGIHMIGRNIPPLLCTKQLLLQIALYLSQEFS